MLSAPAVDLTFDDDEWTAQPITARFYKTASVGSWGVTSIGRGFNWTKNDDEVKQSPKEPSGCVTRLEAISQISSHDIAMPPNILASSSAKQQHSFQDSQKISFTPTQSFKPLHTMPSASYIDAPIVRSPVQSRSASPIVINPSLVVRSSLSRSPSSPRPRRRSSQQRVSLVSGRVMIAPADQSSLELQPLRRTDSSSSALSAQSTRPPSPSTAEKQSFLGEKKITDFIVECEIGRGAYGLVKRARDVYKDGTVGVRMRYTFFLRPYGLCIAASGYQTDHQGPYFGRLLEETFEARNHSHRNLCHVCHIQYLIHITLSPRLGSHTSMGQKLPDIYDRSPPG